MNDKGVTLLYWNKKMWRHHFCIHPSIIGTSSLVFTSHTTFHVYFVSPRERPWRQRVSQRKTPACYHARNLCVFSHVHKGTPGLKHKGCVLQRASVGTLSDVTVVLGMRQSIHTKPSCVAIHSTFKSVQLKKPCLLPTEQNGVMVCSCVNILMTSLFFRGKNT